RPSSAMRLLRREGLEASVVMRRLSAQRIRHRAQGGVARAWPCALHTCRAFPRTRRRCVKSLLPIRSLPAYKGTHGQNKEHAAMTPESISLVVDEPIAGHFYWVLQKQDGAQCRAIDAAEGPMPTYGAAMMAGIAALQR